MSDDRFSLGAIQKQQELLARAKENARRRDNRSTAWLLALTNLPWLIAILAFLWWKFH